MRQSNVRETYWHCEVIRDDTTTRRARARVYRVTLDAIDAVRPYNKYSWDTPKAGMKITEYLKLLIS